MGRTGPRTRAFRTIGMAVAAGFFPGSNAMAGVVEVFHADSLAGPMGELLKKERTSATPIPAVAGL